MTLRLCYRQSLPAVAVPGVVMPLPYWGELNSARQTNIQPHTPRQRRTAFVRFSIREYQTQNHHHTRANRISVKPIHHINRSHACSDPLRIVCDVRMNGWSSAEQIRFEKARAKNCSRHRHTVDQKNGKSDEHELRARVVFDVIVFPKERRGSSLCFGRGLTVLFFHVCCWWGQRSERDE